MFLHYVVVRATPSRHPGRRAQGAAGVRSPKGNLGTIPLWHPSHKTFGFKGVPTFPSRVARRGFLKKFDAVE